MHITDAATLSGLPADTIRFYEKSGMLPAIARDARGWRSFGPADIEWLKTLRYLRNTGMPLDDVKAFARSAHAADSTARDQQQTRLALLRTHARRLAAQQADLAACQTYLTHKIAIYTSELETT